MNAKMIFIEGTDRSGKGSLIQAIHKATNYKHVIFDRGPISNMVYASANGRLDDELMRQYEKLESQLQNVNHTVIYLWCETDELIRRMKATNHEYVDFNLHKELFEAYIETSPLNVVKVRSDKLTPEELAEKLVKNNII